MSACMMLFLKRSLSPFSFSLPSRHSISFTSKLSAVKSSNELDSRRHQKIAMTRFLLNELGFSESRALAFCKKNESLFKAESIGRAQQVVQLFRDYGFTEDQVRKIFFVQPRYLKVKVDTRLKPKLEFMKALGFTGSNLGHCVSREPRLLSCSLEHHLSRNISMLVSAFGSKLNLCKILMHNPRFWLFKFDNLESKIDILKQYGMRGELLLHVISIRPYLILGSEDMLKLKIEYVRNLGVLEGSKVFAGALAAVDSSGLENFENKFKHLATLGLLENEILQIVRKCPSVFTKGIDKITKNMDFLKNVAGFQPNVVVTYPRLLGYSVESRLQPRHKVIEFLTETELSRLPRNLATVYEISEKCFADKFLMGSSEAANLFDKYKGKSVDVEVGVDREGI